MVRGEFESITETDSHFDGQILINGEFKSTTKTNAYFYGNIRVYKHDPKKFNKSEPIFIYDRNENLQLILSDDGIPYTNGEIPEQVNGAFNLNFDVIANNPEVAKIENDGRAVTRNADGTFAEFIIRNVEDIDGASGTFKNVRAEGSDYELIDEFLSRYTQANISLKNALTAILQGTRWQAGYIDLFNNRSVDLRNMTVKEAVIELLDLFSAEVRYRVEVKGNRIVGRYIDIYRKRGANFGKRFEDGKDILSTSRNLDSARIKTALHGRGASDENGNRLDFSSVAWSKTNGDPADKPLGQGWIGDDNARAVWGYENGDRHKFGWYDGQEEDPAALLLSTWEELQTLKKLRETYDFSVIQIAEALGLEHEQVSLGDTVLSINRRMYPPAEVEASIIEYRHNLNDAKRSRVVLGQFRSKFDMSRRINDIEKDYNDKRGEFDKKPGKEFIESEVSEALREAQERIDAAKEELEQAMEEIGQGKIDLEQAADLIQDTIDNPQNYKGDFVGDLIADSLIVRGPITSINATITGTILANNATFMRANIEKANIIDANIVDATITGSLSGVDGTFVGDLIGARIMSNSSIDVTTDLRVGNNIYIGPQSVGTGKGIYFDGNTSITTGSFGLQISAFEELDLSAWGDISLLSSYGNVHTNTIFTLGNVVSSRRARVFHDPSGTTGSAGTRDRLKLEAGNGQAGVWISPLSGSVYFRHNNENIHAFHGNGNKIGGSIKIDDNRYGMSPIDSPQTLISDLVTNIYLDGVAKIYLDEIYVKSTSDYAVFPNNSTVKILEKHDDYFIVEGEGLTDFQIIGTRRGYDGAYFADMSRMSENMESEADGA